MNKRFTCFVYSNILIVCWTIFFTGHQMWGKIRGKKRVFISIDLLLHHPLLTRCTNMACHTSLGMILSLNRKFEDEIVQFHSWGMNFNLRQKLRIKIGYFALIFDRILFSKSRLNSSVPNYNKGSKQTFGIHGAWYVQ